jgi:hypothetical protein
MERTRRSAHELQSASQGRFDHLPAIDASLSLPEIEERIWTFNERFIE